jgi:hypothetical protein
MKMLYDALSGLVIHETGLILGLDASFDNAYDCKRIREKTGKVNVTGTKFCVRNDETSP